METDGVKHKCQGRMRFLASCGRRPTRTHEGKHYCWQHDPARLKAVADLKCEARKEEMAKQSAAWNERDRVRKLRKDAQVDDLTDEELVALAALGGVREMLRKLVDKA